MLIIRQKTLASNLKTVHMASAAETPKNQGVHQMHQIWSGCKSSLKK